MKKLSVILCLFLPLIGLAQSMGNFGNLQLHQGALVGVHEDLDNRGNIIANSNTLMGFYGASPNIISGLGSLNLFDVEFGNDLVTFLQIPINIANNANFISGNVLTPLNLNSINLNFNENAFYTGASDTSKVSGFASVLGQNDFIFPIGDPTQTRVLEIKMTGTTLFAQSAYLAENPSSPNSINVSFNTNNVSSGVGLVSPIEFWLLNSAANATITVGWIPSSSLALIASDISDIILVGWELETERWVPLSEPTGIGDLDNGSITSNTFVPDEYGAITFGTVPLPLDTFAVNNPTLGDYFISPNNDAVNDGLVFDELQGAGANMVRIYNKSGQKVFEKQNYTNEFRGFANSGSLILKQGIGLPEGVYYYTVDLLDEKLAYQGFVFLNR